MLEAESSVPVRYICRSVAAVNVRGRGKTGAGSSDVGSVISPPRQTKLHSARRAMHPTPIGKRNAEAMRGDFRALAVLLLRYGVL